MTLVDSVSNPISLWPMFGLASVDVPGARGEVLLVNEVVDDIGVVVIHDPATDPKKHHLHNIFQGCEPGHTVGQNRPHNCHADHIQNAANSLIYERNLTGEGYARSAIGDAWATTLSRMSNGSMGDPILHALLGGNQ